MATQFERKRPANLQYRKGQKKAQHVLSATQTGGICQSDRTGSTQEAITNKWK